MSDQSEEFGFAFKGVISYDLLEQRVLREARELHSQGKLEILGDPVRTKFKGLPYVYVPVRRLTA